MPRLAGCTVVFAVAVGLLGPSAGCLPFPGDSPPPVNVGDRLRAEYVVKDARHPSALAFAADGRVFYGEKNTGRIRVIANSQLVPEPFATVPVNSAGSRGLLGLALHPDFERNRRVYVFYTRSDTGQSTSDPQAVIDNRVVYFEASGNVAAGAEVFVASLLAEPATTRVGGRIAFGADGKLLVTIGDLTDADSAQDPGFLVGKILRYNDDGSIPEDNPTPGSPVYALGLRDPQGLCVDPESNAAFFIDHNDGYDEVNRLRPGGNYGWPIVSGKANTTEELEFAGAHPEYADPLFGGTARLVGGSFNPSTRYGPDTRLHFFYGEAHKRQVMSAELSTNRDQVVRVQRFAREFPDTITDVAFTPAGTLYVACERAIFRVVPYP